MQNKSVYEHAFFHISITNNNDNDLNHQASQAGRAQSPLCISDVAADAALRNSIWAFSMAVLPGSGPGANDKAGSITAPYLFWVSDSLILSE